MDAEKSSIWIAEPLLNLSGRALQKDGTWVIFLRKFYTHAEIPAK